MKRRVIVFGPAYLDRVLRVDRPLLPPGRGASLDRSAVAGAMREGGETLTVADRDGSLIVVGPPAGWPGPLGHLRLGGEVFDDGPTFWVRQVVGEGWADQLGGMGAGFAAALGGELRCILGGDGEPMSRRVVDLLRADRIAHRPWHRAGARSDWTLLVSSAGHGDKLAIGFRGCLDGLDPAGLDAFFEGEADLRVVAGWPNGLAARALAADDAAVRLFAPAMRNARGEPSVSEMARDGLIDLLCCNRGEWEALRLDAGDAARIPVISVTDGPRGGMLSYRSADGDRREHSFPAFPRLRPPRDTNRAGEAFASALISTLLDGGWCPGPADDDLIRGAALRASAAAALVLDLEHFGFPDPVEVDRAVDLGEVP